MATGKGRGILLQNSGSCSCKTEKLWKSFWLKEESGKNVRWWREVCHILIFDKNSHQRKMFSCLNFTSKLMDFLTCRLLKSLLRFLLDFCIKHVIFAKCSNAKCYSDQSIILPVYTICFAVIMFILSLRKVKGCLLSSLVAVLVGVFFLFFFFTWIIFLVWGPCPFLSPLPPHTSEHNTKCKIIQYYSVLCFSHIEDILDHKVIRTPMSKAK